MRWLFSTGSLYSYGLDRCFKLAAAVGFDGIELMVDWRADSVSAPYLESLIERYAIPIVAIHSPFVGGVPGWPADDPGRIQASVALAERLGASVVVHHLPLRLGFLRFQLGRFHKSLPIPGWNGQVNYRRWLMDAYSALQARTSVALCIENMPAFRRLGRPLNFYHWNTIPEWSRFPALTMDTTHLGTWNLEPVEIYPRLGGRVRHIHLSNFDGQEHRLPQHGWLHLDRLLAHLSAEAFPGTISLEVYGEMLGAGRPDDAVEGSMRETLAWCRSAAGES